MKRVGDDGGKGGRIMLSDKNGDAGTMIMMTFSDCLLP